MAEQSPLSDEQVRDAFNKARQAATDKMEKNGSSGILQALSNTIRQLQDAGADISVEIVPGPSNSAYDMVYTVAKKSESNNMMEAHGFVRIGEAKHLFAVVSKFAGAPVEQIYISQYGITEGSNRLQLPAGTNGGQTRTVIYGDMYDFGTDATAIQKLQNKLAELAGAEKAVLANDSAGVFNKPAQSLQKPSLKIKN